MLGLAHRRCMQSVCGIGLVNEVRERWLGADVAAYCKLKTTCESVVPCSMGGCWRIPQARDWAHTVSKRAGSTSMPSSRFRSLQQDWIGVSPGNILPPTNHQSGWGWTMRLARNMRSPSGDSRSISEHALTRQSSASPYASSDKNLRCELNLPVS